MSKNWEPKSFYTPLLNWQKLVKNAIAWLSVVGAVVFGLAGAAAVFPIGLLFGVLPGALAVWLFKVNDRESVPFVALVNLLFIGYMVWRMWRILTGQHDRYA